MDEIAQPTAMTALVVRRGRIDDLCKIMRDPALKKEMLPKLRSEQVVELANINASFQAVLSGYEEAVAYAAFQLQSAMIAARGVNLPVSYFSW